MPFCASAAFKSSADLPTLDSAFNPHKMDDDLSLPMPCGLTLALRGAVVPSGALIRDKTFPMGIANPRDHERQIYERQFYGHISAPFTEQDLPRAWQESLKKTKTSRGDTWYFIGKYEISRLQWQAVMQALNADGSEDSAMCPKIESDSNLPVANVSWFEVQEFLNKYNAWLIKNHKDDLPGFTDSRNVAFLRLPTEEEWEYAARGGARVAPEWWVSQDFFPAEDGKTSSDYGIYNQGTALSKPAPIGSRHPNPLGIYDTAGNVSEMVDGFFRMSIVDMRDGKAERRLHGAAGGILTKGGSYRSDESQILPGWRDETPLYTADGPGKSNELGLRLVLAGLNFPNAQRLTEIRNEELTIPNQSQKNAEVNIADATPLEAVIALENAAEGDMKKHLQELHAKIQDKELAEASANSQRLENTFRSLLYQAETLRAFAYRYSAVSANIPKIKELIHPGMEQEEKKDAEDLLAKYNQNLKDYFHSLQMGANYYKTNLDFLLHVPEAELARLTNQIREEYSGSSVFNSHMRQNIDTLERYLQLAKKNGLASLTTTMILKGIIPASHYKLLPLS